MNKIVCRLADVIVLCNQKYMTKVTEIYNVPQNKVRVVDMWRRFPKYTEPSYSKHALFFGRMNPYKGVDNLIEIIKQCPEIQFDIVGRVDPQIREQVDELKQFPNVSMNTGYVTDTEMEAAFVKADWIVLPYNSATQSGVVIDGYRYGRPSIAFNVGAIAEQIEDGVSNITKVHLQLIIRCRIVFTIHLCISGQAGSGLEAETELRHLFFVFGCDLRAFRARAYDTHITS